MQNDPQENLPPDTPPPNLPPDSPPVEKKSEATFEDEIDKELKETFPASDPPSWVLGVDPDSRHSPDRIE